MLKEDYSLSKLYRQGDPAALRVMYHRYAKDIGKFIRNGFINPKTGIPLSCTLDDEMQRDLVQETFLRFFSENARRSYDSSHTLRSFILAIAKNTIIDFLRKKPLDALRHTVITSCIDDTDNEDSTENQPTHLVKPEQSMEGILYKKQCLEAIRAYISTLDKTLKNLIRLRFVDELTQEEAAKQLNLTRWKVRALEKKIACDLQNHLKTKMLLK
jgi:RNA polymerase sigma factor (sigma-70 family)